MPLGYRAAAVCAVLFSACMCARAQVLTEPVGTTSTVQTATVTVTTAGTIGAINVLTQGAPNLDFNFVSGGTCAVGTAYSVGQTCTVQFTFTPRVPGARYGGITLTSGSTVLASTYISGTGLGPLMTFGSGAPTAIGGGFINPSNLAVDASGNIFVAVWGGELVQEIVAAGGYTTTKTLGSGFSHPWAVAVDGMGNVFVTDLGSVVDNIATAVKEITAASGYTTVKTLNSGSFVYPGGIAVDASGNIFVSDNTANTVSELTAASGYATVTALAQTNGHFNSISGLALDANNNLFISDTNNNVVKEALAAGGYTTVNTLGSGYNFPTSIAVDASESVYVSNHGTGNADEFFAAGGYVNSKLVSLGYYVPLGVALDGTGSVFVLNGFGANVVKLDFDTETLHFATTKVGTTSADSPQTVTFYNNGNSALTFTVPASGTNPSITSGFTVGSGSTCPILSPGSSAATLAAGASCTYQINFSPLVAAGYAGSMTITDNSVGVTGSTQTVFLTGTGTNALIATGSTLTVSPNPAPVGSTVTLTANVTTNPSTSTGFTGTVTFYDGATVLGIVPVTSPGIATFSLNTLPPGGNSLTCVYSGDGNFAGSSCAPVTENIYNPQTITFPPLPTQAYAGTSVLLTATASSGLPVTYSVMSGPATVSGAVLTYTGAGTVVVEADQAGNASYSAAVPVQRTVTTTVLTEPVGTQSPAVSTVVTFTAAGTLGTINVLTQGAPNLDFKLDLVPGNTCIVSTLYSAGDTCTMFFTFTPTRPGLRYGGISLTSTTGTTIANAYIYGLGTGPQVIYAPGTQSLIGSGLTNPSGVAADGSGDIFVSTCVDLCDNTGTSNSNGLSEILANGTVRNIGSFVQGDDVAVDGSGNVFIIWNRTNVSEVLAVNGVIPASPVINLLASSFVSLDGMKVDGNGNVFVADGASATGARGGIYELLAVNGSMPASPTIVQIGANNTVLTSPTGIAIDAAGDVFESDETNDAAYELMAVNGVVPASPVVKTIASNLPEPTNIALDAAGNVFVSVVGAAGVYEALAQGGYSTVVPLGTSFSFADGLAVDASGNVFVADNSLTQVVKLDFADAPSLTFATTQVGSTSTDSPQTVSLINDGNAALDWAAPPSGTDPSISTNYTFTSTCGVITAGTALAYSVPEGGSCAESISFTPVVAGTDNGTFTLTDNDLNVTNAQQNIKLNATGTSAPTTLTLTSSANPTYALQPITFTVHLTTNGQGDAGQSVTLTYTVGTLVVAASLTTDSTGLASYAVIGGLNPGSYVVSAAFAGTTSYLASSATIMEVVNAIPTTSTLSVFPVQPVVNTNIVLTAVVAAQLSGPPTGTVTFLNGTTTLGTVALSSAGVAQYTITALPVGNYSFSCTYNGATDYATSSCQTITDTVVPIPDFSLTATPPSITIETQHHKTMQLTLTGIGLFSGPVYLQCQGPLPPYLTCELPQSETLAVGQTLNFNFTMDTDAVLDFLAANRPVEKTPWTNAPGRMVLAMLLPLVLAGFVRRRKTLRRLLLLAVLVVGATGLTACGDKWPAHTPPGTYVIPVVGTGTANGTTITHTLNITLTVTP